MDWSSLCTRMLACVHHARRSNGAQSSGVYDKVCWSQSQLSWFTHCRMFKQSMPLSICCSHIVLLSPRHHRQMTSKRSPSI